MKTKNIFRMLLVAVTLLLGANNVMADDIEIWTGNVTPSYWPPTYISVGDKLSNAQEGDVLRLEGTSGGYAQAKLAVADSDGGNTTDIMGDYIKQPDFNEAGYFDITLTPEQANALNSHSYLAVFADQFTLTRIVLISGTSTDPGSGTGTDPVEPISYTVTINATTNGTVTASAESATEGTEITLTVAPDEGYELDELIVNNGDVTVTDNKFTMPASDVTITATFKLTETEPVEPTTYTITVNSTSNGTILADAESATEGTLVTLTITPDSGYELESLSVKDANNNDVNVTDNQFTMPASSVTISGTFKQLERPDYTFTINVTGPGAIYLYRDSAKEGEEITINPAPDQYYYELGEISVVDESGNEISVSADYKFTMPASNVTINATFVGKEYSVTWKIKDETEPYQVDHIRYGDAIVEPTTPEREGYVFAGWENHSETMGAGDITINGAFYYNIYLIYDETKGEATLSKTLSLGNEEIQLTVTPANGYEVSSVTVTDANGNKNVWGSYQFRIDASDLTVTVTFKETDAVTHSINNNNNSQHGSVWANVNQAEEGATITLSNQPDTGYELDHYIVTDANGNTIEVNGNQFTMPANNVWISAVFKLINYTVTINGTANGTVTADKTTNVHYGDEVTLTVTPAEGYELDVLTVKDANNNNVDVNNNKFNMPASNVTVTATFKQTGSGPVGPTIPEDIENEHRLWTGPESAEGSDGHVSNLTANLFTDIKTGDTFRVYVSDINNDQNWKLYITDNVNGWNSQVFEGFTGGDILRNNGGSAYYHAEDGYGYFEFTCTDQSVANFKNNGTQMSFQWMTITKVTYISNNTTPTQKTRFSFSFNQSYIYVTYGVDTFTGQYPSANKQLGDEVWNNLTWSSSNTYVADVDNNGNVTINGIGTTYITVSFAGNDNYYATSETYTLVVQPNVRTASIGTSGYATFSCDVALDFSGITSLRAYIAKSIDANWVVLQQVTGTVAANTGLVIVGTTTDIPVVDSGSSFSDNLLVPGTGGTVGGPGIYVLTNESGTVKFADTSAHSATVPVGKAYLQASGTSAARLNIRWEGDATGIKALKSDFNSDDVIYDLNGQRVITPNKGLYIINGKKVVIK